MFRALVPVVANDASRFHVDVAPDHRVTDKVEMGELGSGENERRFQFRPWADDAIFTKPTSAAQIGSRANKATSTENKGSFQDCALFDSSALVPGNFAFDYEVPARERCYLLLDDHG